MFDHVTLRVADLAASNAFYDAVLGELGIEKTTSDSELSEWDDFGFGAASAEVPPTTGLHIGFAAPSREHVDRFWQAGIDAGARSDGEPGPRPQYTEDYYGGFLLDPDGNSAEAVHHGRVRPGGIDHLWLRVSDVAASAGFYERVAPFGGFEVGRIDEDYAFFRTESASFSLVPGEPTRNVHLAFPGASNAVVDAFHAALTGAGHPDNGAPGERPVYHPGYYGAFVLDPDGNNVEVVCHNR